jgi:hypothetical protein
MIAETFLVLLTAHLIGDFVAQTDWMVERKKRPDVLLLHVFIVTAIAAILLGAPAWKILATTFVTHLASDFVKTHFSKDTLAAFIADQVFHIAVAAALALFLPLDFSVNPFVKGLGPAHQNYYFAALVLASGLIGAVQVGAIVVRKFVARYTQEITDDLTGIKGAGALIGRLERLLIIILFVGGQPDGIGFLVAAKSILRFGEISHAKDRKVSEYIIIGTFMSFAWGISCGMLMMKALEKWPV